jgi:RNA polymerase sigma factor (sigma-70 family)
MTDHDLLQAYARDGSQPAFATLVGRHLNLVYSVARRVTRSPQLAEEVAQAVFADLARQAGSLGNEAPVVAWLHVVSRRKSVDAVRRESRRQLREGIAASLSDSITMNPPHANWTEIEPLLDEAVESLPPADRSAILLRFFENKSLREVGAALGTSDDAAQKRVSRALDELRAFLLRRGVAISAAGLATNISAHALLTAPAALGSAIGAAIGAASVTVPAAVLTLAQKALIGAGVAAAVAIVVHQGLSRSSAPSPAVAAQPAVNVAATAPETNPPPRAVAATGPRMTPGSTEDFRVALLRQLFTELPAQSLPELRLLAPADWAEVARAHELATAADIRLALAKLRALARKKFATPLQSALRRFTDGSGGVLPDTIAQLAPHLDAPADAEMLARYTLKRTGRLGEADEELVVENPTSDVIMSVTLNGWQMRNNSDYASVPGEAEMDTLERAAKSISNAMGPEGEKLMDGMVGEVSALKTMIDDAVKLVSTAFGGEETFRAELKDAVRQFAAAHPGESVSDLGQILPFFPGATKLMALARTDLAPVAYLAAHPGQPPPNAEQLRRYLASAPDLTAAFKSMKLAWDGEQLTMSFNFKWDGKKD